MTRRMTWSILCGVLPLAALPLPSVAAAADESWAFNSLQKIGGRPVMVEGAPQVTCWAGGRAIAFDGIDDRLVVHGRPLVGAGRFTIEVLMRPDGGTLEQRFLHIAETDPQTDQDVRASASTHDANHRIMFELRAVDGGFYIDGFLRSRAGEIALAIPAKLHPVGSWYVLAQTYDGARYRTYVNGVLQGDVATPFAPQGPGNVGIGSRLNKTSYFRGAIARMRFTERALSPHEFLKVPHRSDSACPKQ